MKKGRNEVLSLLEEYFTKYLPDIKGVSSNTIRSYQYAFQLLFKYLEAEKGIQPEKIPFTILSGDMITDFLLYLEQERNCSIQTRNLRHSAIVSFAKFASKKSFANSLPFYTDAIDLPVKRQPKQLGVKYFTKDEIALLLQLPNTTKLIGQRDVTLLSLNVQRKTCDSFCNYTHTGIYRSGLHSRPLRYRFPRPRPSERKVSSAADIITHMILRGIS